jgi:hypothetical protein
LGSTKRIIEGKFWGVFYYNEFGYNLTEKRAKLLGLLNDSWINCQKVRKVLQLVNRIFHFRLDKKLSFPIRSIQSLHVYQIKRIFQLKFEFPRAEM